MNSVGLSDQIPLEGQTKRRMDAIRGFAITLGIILLIVAGQIVFSGMTEGYCVVWPSIGTQFSPGYNERAFAKIAPGMTEAEVLSLLGAPLGSRDGPPAPYGATGWQPGDRTWTYSQDSSARGGDWAWLARQVVFRDGRVVQTFREVYYD